MPPVRTDRAAGVNARTQPLVKWAGGKSQLLTHLAAHFPASFQRYVEPFLGGGAVYCHLQPKDALLSDSNAALIEVYWVVQQQAEALITALKEMQPHVLEPDYYYAQRAADPTALSPVARAARFIYLNKTCYNGLYRVNRRGQFNVPFGHYKRPPRLCDDDNLRAVCALLQGADLRHVDFETVLAETGAGDFVYLDPPYDPLSATAYFTSYTAASFGRGEQERLAATFRAADARGAQLLLNNSDTPFIRQLYPGYRIEAVEGLMRAINSDPTKRKGVTELVIKNY